jgi:Ca2+/Na+ antiporter
MDTIYFLSGLVILGFAGEATLRGAVGMAHRLNISPAVIGLTVVGFGTSLPELVVCVQAALDGKPDLAIGNIVGSNIANTLLILGVGALIFPLICHPRSVRRDGMAMVLATVFCVILAVLGEIRPWIGIAMVVTLVTYLGWPFKYGRAAPDAATELHEKSLKPAQNSDTDQCEPDIYHHRPDWTDRRCYPTNKGFHGHRPRIRQSRIDYRSHHDRPRHVVTGTVCHRHRRIAPTRRCCRWKRALQQSIQYIGHIGCDGRNRAADIRGGHTQYLRLDHAGRDSRGSTTHDYRIARLPDRRRLIYYARTSCTSPV